MKTLIIAGCLMLMATAGSAQDGKDRAKEVLDAARKAKGSIEKLQGVKDMTVSGTASVNVQGQDMDLTITAYTLPPDKVRQEIVIPAFNVSVTQFVSGSTGFMDSPQGAGDMPEVMVGSLRRGLLREWFVDFLFAPPGKELQVTAKPDAKVDSKAADVMEVKIGDETFTVYFDKETHDLIKSSYQTMSQEMQLVGGESLFSDFKDVSGIRLAHHSLVFQGGQKTADIKISETKLNTGVDEAKFKK